MGIPGSRKTAQEETEESGPFYQSLEDELLQRVDNTEREMQEMMTYLDSVEKVMSGDDLGHIKRMLDYTGQNVTHHTKAYSGIRNQV